MLGRGGKVGVSIKDKCKLLQWKQIYRIKVLPLHWETKNGGRRQYQICVERWWDKHFPWFNSRNKHSSMFSISAFEFPRVQSFVDEHKCLRPYVFIYVTYVPPTDVLFICAQPCNGNTPNSHLVFANFKKICKKLICNLNGNMACVCENCQQVMHL